MTNADKKNYALEYINDQGPYNANPKRQKLSHFTAGIPGAGKTETATSLKKRYKKDFGYEILHMDIDLHRENLKKKGYEDRKINSYANRVLESTIDQAVYQKLDFILDSTFAYTNYDKNLKRAFKYDYLVIISCIFAPTGKCWEYVEKRKLKIGREVPRFYFDKCIKCSAKNVLEAKRVYGDDITVDLYIKGSDLRIESKPLYNVSIERIDKEITNFYNSSVL